MCRSQIIVNLTLFLLTLMVSEYSRADSKRKEAHSLYQAQSYFEASAKTLKISKIQGFVS